MHESSLIVTVATGLVLAFAFGFIAARLRFPPLVGYLLAGVAIAPLAAGPEVDAIASQLSEIGVILLMFGVGLHFSASDLLAVRWIAIPGAVGQILWATLIGALVALAFGWGIGAALVLGLALSVASTVVLLRALDQRNGLETTNGRIAIGWLIVEDLAMVLALVFVPTLAAVFGTGPVDPHAVAEAAAPAAEAAHAAESMTGNLFLTIVYTIAKVGAFVAVVLLLGPKVVPWILGQVARVGSRELFTLSVLAIALGIAVGSAQLFGVSIALGAFLAGVVLNGTELSHKAATDSLPLQDAFAVLFFFSIGMLFDPWILVEQPLHVIAVLLVIVIGKSIGAFLIVAALRFPLQTAVFVSASLAQIGEFSFILATLGTAQGLLPVEAGNLIVAGALLSIMFNPIAFALVDPVTNWLRGIPWLARFEPTGPSSPYATLERQLEQTRREAEEKEAERVSNLTKDLVNKFPMFTGLDAQRREELLTLFRPKSAAPGERLIRTGERADMAYFISSGAVEVAVGDRRIHLGPGDIIGEMALLSGGRRTADVTAIDYSQFLTLDQWDFRQFIAKYPEIGEKLNEVAAQRDEMNRREREGAPPAAAPAAAPAEEVSPAPPGSPAAEPVPPG
ncbi:MAG: cation:proton antiporter [Bauldia sp.]|nr:cation:proton antiporter [Bauldia sp.]